MIEKEIVESSFLAQNSTYYELSILIGMDSLIFVVVDERKMVLALKHWRFEIVSTNPIENFKSTFRNEPILNLKFKKVQIAYSSKSFTLVPEKLYNENHSEAYLKNITEVSSWEEIFTDYIPNQKICNVFSIPKEIKSFFIEKYPEASFYHSTTVLLNSFSRLKSDLEAKKLLLNLAKGTLDVIFIDKGTLKLLNSYDLSSGKDLLYYSLLIVEQFGLEQVKQEIWVTGHIDENSDLFQQLRRYLPQSKVLNSYVGLQTGPKFQKHIEFYKYFNILHFPVYTNDPNL